MAMRPSAELDTQGFWNMKLAATSDSDRISSEDAIYGNITVGARIKS